METKHKWAIGIIAGIAAGSEIMAHSQLLAMRYPLASELCHATAVTFGTLAGVLYPSPLVKRAAAFEANTYIRQPLDH